MPGGHPGTTSRARSGVLNTEQPARLGRGRTKPGACKEGTMDRRQLLQRLDKAWLEFEESYAGLSDSQILEPGVQGRWSVRDILAHVTTWEEEALTHLPLILEGGRPPRYSTRYGGIDAFNALMTERKARLSLSA